MQHQNQQTAPSYVTLERLPDSSTANDPSLSQRHTPRSAYRWLSWVAFGALAVTTLPTILGFLAAPAGQEFGGALNNVGDLAQYLAMIRQGSEGHWLYRDQFTSLAAPHVLMYPLYALFGQTLGRLGLSPLLVFQIARVAGGLSLIVALYWLCGIVFTGLVARRFAVTLAMCSSGLYWLALMLSGPLARWDVQPVQLTAPEFSVITTLLGAPHLAFGLAAQLLTFGCYLRAVTLRSTGWALGGAAAIILVGLSYPFNLLPIDCVLAGTALYAAWRRASLRRSWHTLVLATVIVLPSLPIALYYDLLFSREPIWRTSGMATTAAVSPLVYLLAFGPLALLALPALFTYGRLALQASRVRSSGDTPPEPAVPLVALPETGAPPPLLPPMLGDARVLIVLWAVVPAILLCLPLWQAGRVANGWSVALALLAATTLLGRRPGQTTLRQAATRRRWIIALSLSNLLLVLIYCSLTLAVHPASYYVPRDLAAVGTWLDRHAHSGDVVLASAGSGNVLAARADVAVVAGQNFQTFDLAGSLRAIAAFYNPTTSRSTRHDILALYHVTYVLDGPWETSIGTYNPALSPDLRPAVFHSGRWTLYPVRAPTIASQLSAGPGTLPWHDLHASGSEAAAVAITAGTRTHDRRARL